MPIHVLDWTSQYAIRAFAKTLEFAPKVLAENAGLDASHVLAGLSAAHANGHATAGVDIEGGLDGTSDNSSGILMDNHVCDILAAIPFPHTREPPAVKLTEENIRQLEDAGFKWSLYTSKHVTQLHVT